MNGLMRRLLSSAAVFAPADEGAGGGGLVELAGQIAGGAGDPPTPPAAGDPPADPPPADPPADPPAGDPPADPPPAAAQPYLPDTLGEEFRGTNDTETIDKLVEHLNALPKPPETPEGYELQLSAEQQARFGDLDKDPVHKIVREVAHKIGLPNEKYQEMFTEVNDRLLEAGLLDQIDPEEELGKLMPKTGDDVEKKAAAARRINDVAAEVRNIGPRLGLQAPQINTMLAMLDTADGVIAFEKLMAATKPKGVNPGGDPPNNMNGQSAEVRQLNAMYPSMNKAS